MSYRLSINGVPMPGARVLSYGVEPIVDAEAPPVSMAKTEECSWTATLKFEEARPFIRLMEQFHQAAIRRVISDEKARFWCALRLSLLGQLLGLDVAVGYARRLLAGRYHTETARRRAARRMLRAAGEPQERGGDRG